MNTTVSRLIAPTTPLMGNALPATRTRAQPRHTGLWRGLLAALCLLTTLAPAAASPLEEAVTEIQRDWEVIRYQTPAAEREKRYEATANRAHQLSELHKGRAETLIWEGIVLSTLAGEKGGLGALSLAKQARGLYEQALQIDPNALEGSAYNSLGVLYYKVPGWPLSFGDKTKAEELLKKALQVNPKGIDPNFFMGELLLEQKRPTEAQAFLERALEAPARPGRQIADVGRRNEVKEMLEKARAQVARRSD